ncbi:Dirigent protein - like 10 [Theobroma cacao]|nr:Dirigent protein - like 10 [Theobroma cacao]
MEPKTSFSLVILVILSISMAKFSIPAKADHNEHKETKISVYFHDYASSGPNSTTLPVGPDPKSASVGRGQGITVTACLDGLNVYVSLLIVFTNEAYNGSTIQIQGNNNQLKVIREYGVVSGTSKFRYAKGYATFENYFFDPSTSYSIIRCNISIRH